MGIRTSSMVFALALVSLGAVVVSQSAVTIPNVNGPMFSQALSLESLDSVQSDQLDKKISVSFREASVQEILKELSKHGVNFIAESSSFKSVRLTLNFDDVTVREALDSVAEIVGAKWERRGNVFTMKPVNSSTPLASRAPRAGSDPEALYRRGFQEYGPRAGVPLARVGQRTPSEPLPPLAGVQKPEPRVRINVAPQGRTMTPEEQKAFQREMEQMSKELRETLGKGLTGDMEKLFKTLPQGKDWEKMTPAERARFEAEMEKLSQRFEGFGESFGKKWEGRFEPFSGKELTPEQEKELEKLFKNFGDDWAKWGETFGKKMELWGEQFGKNWDGEMKKLDGQRMRDMSPKERAEFEKEMQKFHKEMETWSKNFSKDMEKWESDFKVFQRDKDGKMRELKPEELEKLNLRIRSLPNLDQFTFPELRAGQRLSPEAQAEMRKQLEKSRKQLEESRKAMRDQIRIAVPKAPVSPRAPGRAQTPEAPAVIHTGDLKTLMASISKAQWEKHDAQGYLKVSDLTPDQRKMLGITSLDGEVSISISVDRKKLTIKS